MDISVTTGASHVVLVVRNLPTNARDVRDVSSIPGLGRSLGEGNAWRRKWQPTPNIQKMKIMASSPITSWEIDGETV